jgi:dTDP-4-dehydrorhamnose reductase
MRKMVSLLKGPILITGGTGQLGHSLADAAAQRGLHHLVVSRPEFDFDFSQTIEACLARAKPWLVINAAAYTAVDAAETDATAADRANHTGPATLAGICAGAGIQLIHISTDYVFDGDRAVPTLRPTPPIRPAYTAPANAPASWRCSAPARRRLFCAPPGFIPRMAGILPARC